MIGSIGDIQHQIGVGENSQTEFKEVILGKEGVLSPDIESIAGEMVAFANAQGGTIFLGVNDDGVAVGLPHDRLKDIEEWIINVATNNCTPPIRPHLRRQLLPTTNDTEIFIILVEIRRGLFVHATKSGRHYERVGSSKQIVTGPLLARLFQERGRDFVFDEQTVHDASTDDLDHDKLREYFGASPKSITWNDLLLNTDIVDSARNDRFHPTVAGLLAFGKFPQKYIRLAYIEAAVYRGVNLTSDDLIHSEQIMGCVDDQIESAIKFVNRFMLKPARKTVGRKDYPQYNLDAIQEAIVNAVAHRDYSIRGSKIRMFLYADRIEIYSPGGLPNNLTLEKIAYRAVTRNELLVSFLSKMISDRTGLVYLESRGEGVRTILDLSEAHSGCRPVYELHGNELLLTIYAQPSPHENSTSHQ
ncbi:MAG: putative DNA binding domain-containing protein [Bacteroidetes bacterium]|nr:putative DNA binding domain-containing protein [Bacteroidota bacterium]